MSDGTAAPDRELRLYEKRVDAMLQLFQRHPQERISGLLRGAQEELKEAADAGTPYYDRWIATLRRRLVAEGVLSDAEIAARCARIAKETGDEEA